MEWKELPNQVFHQNDDPGIFSAATSPATNGMEVTPKAAVSSTDEYEAEKFDDEELPKSSMGIDQQAAMEKEGEEHEAEKSDD